MVNKFYSEIAKLYTKKIKKLNEKKKYFNWLVSCSYPYWKSLDITLRAIETLKKMDYILAEDTRVTSKLLKFYDINVKMRSFNLNNEHKLVPKILSEFDKYSKIALVSDAGSPSISDPGFLIVRECVKNNITVHAFARAYSSNSSNLIKWPSCK